MGSSQPDQPVALCALQLAQLAVSCLLEEVNTWPKPGLVSHVDNGSHIDMDADTFYRSAAAIEPFFAEMAQAGQHRACMQTLREIGVRAEHAMLKATGGVNTHRGAIFGMGMLCAAAGLRAGTPSLSTSPTLGDIVMQYWGNEIIKKSPYASLDSHGEKAHQRYGAGGARQEAAQGFPSVYQVGIPALHHAYQLRPDDAHAARVHACFALIAALEDTNLLHRAGLNGLQYAQNTAQGFLNDGGVGQTNWLPKAIGIHLAFVAQKLSPGGSADLLAMSIFAHHLDPI